jgi:hypothetical protein
MTCRADDDTPTSYGDMPRRANITRCDAEPPKDAATRSDAAADASGCGDARYAPFDVDADAWRKDAAMPRECATILMR